jgi:hypothetical protein
VTKNLTLAREFFKPLGHLTDNNLKVFMQHLLGRTPNRDWLYPKVTVHKTSKVHCSHYSAAEWVDRRKKKMIVLQELNNIDHSLKVVMAEGTVDNEKWRAWKCSHNVSSVAWNVLLTIILALYFAKRLTNEGKLKRALEFLEKFPVVLHVLSNFLRLKKNFKVAGGSGKFRTINYETMMLGRDWTYQKAAFLSNHGSSRNPRAQCSVGSCEASIFSPFHVNFVDIEASFHVNACNMGLDYKLAKQVSSRS